MLPVKQQAQHNSKLNKGCFGHLAVLQGNAELEVIKSNSFMSWIGGKKSSRDIIIPRFPLYYERYDDKVSTALTQRRDKPI